jgi:hypothetical protein
MTTTINNDERVFLLTGDMGKKIFCNLSDIPKAVREFDDPSEIEIFHFWNLDKKRASKKLLNDMFKAAQMKFRVS